MRTFTPQQGTFIVLLALLAGTAEPSHARATAAVPSAEPSAEPSIITDNGNETGNDSDNHSSTDSDEPNHWQLAVAPYTRHWRYNAEHREVWAIGIERARPDGWLVGASVFRNSFGQPSSYAYIGRKYEGMLGVGPLFTAWTGGLLYGYTGKYKTKVPLNVAGFAPGLVVSAGWQFDRRTSMQFNLLGDAAVMWQLNYAWR